MLTGFQPWFGKSIEEIYQLVVIKQEKPKIPSGLPPAVENVIKDVLSVIFGTDFNGRYSMCISKNAGYSDGRWVGLESRALSEKSSAAGYTSCETDGNDDVLIKIPGIHKPLRVQESALERVTSGFAVGDWVV
ncbi:hypothetical protein GH714_038765 [Hevea brasiliensis]|uniref:Uncharacterized protein n=1 Tax=Hevea brasiliensis TaxID=3981 RepID=A0A6A6KYX6_HEVBR|nr:hypothetical protein GH714_038765 [Hevea brasiliensis]